MNDDEIEIVPIPMDRETVHNLVVVARAVGEHPTQQVAREVLRLGAAAAAAEIAQRGRLHS